MLKPRDEPQRTCVACRQTAGQSGLIRFYRDPRGALRLDSRGGAAGRGAYLHPQPGCLERARRRRLLERALRAQADGGLWENVARMTGLLLAGGGT